MTLRHLSHPSQCTHTHTHQSKPQIRSSLLARRHMEMWLSGLGASLAFPHSYNALLPANVSAAVHQDLGLASRANECSFPCLSPILLCPGGQGSWVWTHSKCPLPGSMSSDPRLGTACLPAVLSPSGGWSRWPCLTLSPLTSEVSLLLGLTNLVQDAGLGGGGGGGKVGRGQFTG